MRDIKDDGGIGGAIVCASSAVLGESRQRTMLPGDSAIQRRGPAVVARATAVEESSLLEDRYNGVTIRPCRCFYFSGMLRDGVGKWIAADLGEWHLGLHCH